jgi:uncharacterized protein (DUF2164 family)
MPLDHKAIIKQIDTILAKSDDMNVIALLPMTSVGAIVNELFSTVHRLAPPGSIYLGHAKLYEPRLSQMHTMFLAIEPLRGILCALRNDYASGHLQSVVELVHADIFADFLDMADYLLQQGYKDPAAVVAGSVLEAHLRKLSGKHGMTVVKSDGTTPKTADALNAELAAGATNYSKLDQKSVLAWLELRNNAAHGKYSAYTKEQVAGMIQGVREFASRHPA